MTESVFVYRKSALPNRPRRRPRPRPRKNFYCETSFDTEDLEDDQEGG
jgi:hypothetical protein